MAIKVCRPSDYKPEFADKVLELGIQGKHVYQMCLELRCSQSTLYRWAEDHKDFREAFTCARHWAKGALMDRVDGNVENKEAQPKLLELKATFLTDYVKLNGFEETDDPVKQLEILIKAVSRGDRSPKTAELMANAIEKRIKAEQELELRPLLEQLREAIKDKK